MRKQGLSARCRQTITPHPPKDLGKWSIKLEVPPRIELGIRELQSHALPLGYGTGDGADDEARTRYLHLGKVALYQMSYIRNYSIIIP